MHEEVLAGHLWTIRYVSTGHRIGWSISVLDVVVTARQWPRTQGSAIHQMFSATRHQYWTLHGTP
eukprot:3161799-Rhodomonas_salina.1